MPIECFKNSDGGRSHANAESVQITFNPWGGRNYGNYGNVDRPSETSSGFVGHLDLATFEEILAAAQDIFEYHFTGCGPAAGCCCVTAFAGCWICWNPKATKGVQFVKEMAGTYPNLDFIYESEFVCTAGGRGSITGIWLHNLIIKPSAGAVALGKPADVAAQQVADPVMQPEATHAQLPPWGEEGEIEWSMEPQVPWAWEL